MKFIHKDVNRLAEILANSNFDFYACAVTPWHLINIEACIADLARKGPVNGLLVINKHVRSGYVLKKNDVVTIDHVKMEVLFQDEIVGRRQDVGEKNKYDKPLYIISPMNYLYELGRSVQNKGRKNVYLIRTDEGTMEYYDDHYKMLTNQRDEQSRRPFIKERIDQFILKSSMKNWPESAIVDRYLMCKNDQGQLTPQKNVVDSVRNFLNYCGKKIPHKQESYALFLSFVWEEDKMWDMSEYKNILTMLQRVLYAKGIKLYVKTHPREKMLGKYNEWGIPIFPSENIALEMLLANLDVKPVAMFGLDSTALINASMLGNCISISLKRLVNQENCSEVMWVGLETFERYFNGYVKFVNDESDIVKLLQTSEIKQCEKE